MVGGILLALALFLLGRFDNPVSRAIRETAADLVTPAIAVVGAPVRWAQGAYDWLEGLLFLHAENARLKARLRRLERQLAEAERLAERGRALSDLLGYRAAPHRLVASGRLVAFDGGAFQESALITVGRRDGVRVGDPVVAGAGLVGRILEAGQRASRVLLITDLNSRVPGRLASTGLRAIAAGRNGPRLSLLFLPAGAAPQPGEMVLTSGADGIFPPDLPVGRVIRRDGGDLLVEPAVAVDRVDRVAVLAAIHRALLEEEEPAESAGRPRPEEDR